VLQVVKAFGRIVCHDNPSLSAVWARQRKFYRCAALVPGILYELKNDEFLATPGKQLF
jgi:hypothetical protein